jgi:hypothetical protein
MLGAGGTLEFSQDAAGLRINLPASPPGKYASVLKIGGLKVNPPTATTSGNPR